MKEGQGSPDKNMAALLANLQRTMLELISLFRDASSAMKGDSDNSLSIKLEEISTKIDVLIDQNAKLAEGIVTVADIVREEKTAKPEPATQAASERYIPSMPEQTQQPQFSAPPQPFGPPPSSFQQPPPMPMMGGPNLPPIGTMAGPAPTPPPRKRHFPNFMP
ncbi:MAG: hypothetical protein ABIF10_00640 [Candidatus Woesearchaeota archaeon]